MKSLLDAQTKSRLCRLNTILRDSKYRYAVIGATAFLIHGVDLTRVTRDIDFTVLIDGDWKDFEVLKRSFGAEGFQSTGIAHRMKTGDGFIIDLLPVGPRFIKDESIRWPDGVVMNANGLYEAGEHALPVTIAGCTIPVAPLPVLVMLKWFAYGDQTEPKHVKDIIRCFDFYEKDRRFELSEEEFEGITYENAGAFLMGIDLGALVSKRQVDLIDTIISDSKDRLFADEEEMEMIKFFTQGLKHRDSIRD